MAEKQVKDYDKFNLRFPDGMREAIAERAKRNGRSMNAEILVILSNALLSDGGDDEWINRLMKIIENTEPTSDEDLEKFGLAISEAIKEVTARINKENMRLQAIADAQIKLSKKPS
ncbi:Arc family DNA-binding protein [Cronobacter sakazakii]|uniref:Arc family DNA-binding protein n=1 Tax=Cronobacter sakazakii TaxID=28141 RepID=UPI000576F5FC|nr:Arc family DNA-binding protein [Cronobacter sakazakii]EIZ9495584.1 Arc family DNA-binding protein [Cronobacter sakazakii]ELY3999426.1 Arc family DNA-binding protein [Cronobacter sakazakii]ELY4528841.1 Arc family DNA-binding protein [Cronobacter sakazakii]PUV56436.1 Arc family DNA-binding protein [Cronobacter sakazakii]